VQTASAAPAAKRRNPHGISFATAQISGLVGAERLIGSGTAL